MTDKEIFEAVKQRFTDPKVMDLLRAGLADKDEMEDVKRAIRYGDAAMRNPILRDKLYKIFDRLLNVVKDDSTTRQMVKQDLRQLQKKQGDSAMSEDLNTANVEKAVMHDCAKHVVHEEWGKGTCIPGEHTLLDDGTVTHYDVMFEHGIEQNVAIEDLTVLVSESHMHAKKKRKMMEAEEMAAVTPEGGEADAGKASRKDLKMPLEKLKAIMEKKKMKMKKMMEEELEQIDELKASTYRSAGTKRYQQSQDAFALDTPETDKVGRQLRDKSNKLIRAAKNKEVGDFKSSLSPATRRKLAMEEEVEQVDEEKGDQFTVSLSHPGKPGKAPKGFTVPHPKNPYLHYNPKTKKVHNTNSGETHPDYANMFRAHRQTNEEVELDEAARTGSVRYSDDGTITHRVLHSSGQNHLTMTHHNEHPGNIKFHGKIDGHPIKFTANPKNKNDFDPSREDIKRHLKQAHPSLPPKVHAEVLNHAASGLKRLSLDIDEATVPKTSKEKDLAALAPPHDKITHADVMVGRGVVKKKSLKEFVEQLSEELSKNASSHEITKALKDKNSVDNRYNAALHNNVERHHLDIMQKDRSSDIRAEVGRHPKASSEHIDNALNDKHPFVRYSALDHNNLTVKAHHVEKALRDSDHHVRALAIQHPTATEHHVKQALNDPHPHVRERAAKVAKERNIKAE